MKPSSSAAAPEASPESKKALALLQRGALEILPENELLERLEASRQSKQALRIKAGFDPTAPDLHLGHTVLLRKLRDFQDLGHHVLFLIGDFTGMIGDPTGRNATRKRMSREDVARNAETYATQVFKILDRDRTEIVFNSSWCQGLSFEDVLSLTARYTVARLLEREDFSRRYSAQESISLIEFMYPLIQGYDSVALKADVELGGSDQKFNLLVGRELQKEYGQRPQVVLTMPLLVGLDGVQKMSKSAGNYIAINETPFSMFAKIMSIPDSLLRDYCLLLTRLDPTEVESGLKEAPFDLKKKLGQLVTDDFHSAGAGDEARAAWEREKGSAGRKQMVLPPDTPRMRVEGEGERGLVQLLVEAGVEKSASAVRRLIESSSIRIGEDLQVVEDPRRTLSFPGEYHIKIGKKRYLILHS
ncbi:MAG: tyrosine--tRNA ligase [Leptospirales bacterium]|nr:tyrosine--tRNA ligase [Leptospirales bacterium]